MNYIAKHLEEHWRRVSSPDFVKDYVARMGKVGTHGTAMQKTFPLDRAGSRPDPVWFNVKPIPDITSFKVTARVRDQFLLKFGLKRNIGGHIEYVKYRNRDLNRYMEHQLRRLLKARETGNWVLFWAIGEALLMNSKVYYIICLNHVFPTWYKTMPWKRMVSLYRQTRSHILTDDMVYSRAYITKASGKLRPLGVPSPSWRIHLCMLNTLLVYAYDHKLSEFQHGFRPGRGTLSAWIEVLSRVLQARNIYEYDLKEYFDRVRIDWCLGTLRDWGLPRVFLKMIRGLCTVPIRLPKNVMLDESQQLFRHMLPKAVRRDYGGAIVGVPQGASFSPFLANVVLEDSLFAMNPVDRDGPHTLQYADDGLFYSDGPINLDPGMISLAGVEFNQDKSGWVKKDGEWLKPLKFLGLVYDGQKNVFYSETRSGKSLVFDKEGLLSALVAEDLGIAQVSGDSSAPIHRRPWEVLAKSRFMGFIQSRLYNGSWNQDELWNRFLLDATRNSWVGRLRQSAVRLVGRVTLFNASSIACRALLSLLRHCDGRARKAWFGAMSLQVPKKDQYTPPKREAYGGKFVNPVPIKVKMAGEWRRAYAMSSMLDFEVWVSHYISRIVHRKDSRYSKEHLFWWYKKSWITKRASMLSYEIMALDGEVSRLRSHLTLDRLKITR